jgi:hypothetical protein
LVCVYYAADEAGQDPALLLRQHTGG